jgi:hypothetical protein
MDQRCRVRLEQARPDADIPPGLLHGLQPPLESFLEPFVASLHSSQQRGHAHDYVRGLLSDLDEKNAEAIAYLHEQQRQGLQKFIGQVPGDDQPLRAERARQIGSQLSQADGVLVFDPSAFPKKGTASVGVHDRGVAGSVKWTTARSVSTSATSPAVTMPWSISGSSCPANGPPTGSVAARLACPGRCVSAPGTNWPCRCWISTAVALPHAWIAGDDERGRRSWFRRQLRQRGESYLLAVPCHTLVRDLAAEPPPWSGRGRRPKVHFVGVDRWCATLPERAWHTLEVGAGEKGPLAVTLARGLVQAGTAGRPEDVPELLVVVREQQADGTFQHDYLLSNSGSVCASVAELARVFQAEHRIEECLQRARGEAGLADYQVRTWEGWQQHQTLALLATWFLRQEARRGKNPDRGADGAAGGGIDRRGAEPGPGVPPRGAQTSHRQPLAETQRGGATVPLEASQPLATSAA